MGRQRAEQIHEPEPTIDLGGVDFYKDEKEPQTSANHQKYVEWLAELGLEPAEDPAAIVTAARAKYQARWDAWFGRYYDPDA